MPGKQEYAQLINDTILFTIDPDTDRASFIREKDRLAEYVYKYKIAESKTNEQFGLEIMETFCSCIRYYDPSKGPFLAYFNQAFKLSKTKAAAKEAIADISGGMHLSGSEKRSISAIHNYLKAHPGISKEAIISNLKEFSSMFGLTPDELHKAVISYNDIMTASGDAMVSDDDDSVTFFDLIPAKNDPIGTIADHDAFCKIINDVERNFLKARVKTQKALSVRITALISEQNFDETTLVMLKEKAFFNIGVYDTLTAGKSKITNRSISEMAGLSEQNMAQIWKRFVSQCQTTTQSV